MARGGQVTFAWTPLAGVARYLFEFTGVGLAFANPNGTDPANGLGGAGGGAPIDGPSFWATVPPTIAPGAYRG